MLRIFVILLFCLIGINVSTQLKNNVKDVEYAVNFYQQTFTNSTVNLVTSLIDVTQKTTVQADYQILTENLLKDFLERTATNMTEIQNYNFFKDKLIKQSKYQELRLTKQKALLEFESLKQMRLQSLPFNLEESYYNVTYLVTNSTFNYFNIENQLQVLELPLKMFHLDGNVYSDSKLWAILPHGPSTRRSLKNHMKSLNSSFLNEIKEQLKPEVVYIEIPVFHIDSLYSQNRNNEILTVNYLALSLNTAVTGSDFKSKEDKEDQDVTKYFEASKPFIFVVFSKEGNTVFIGHFCNPGPNHQVTKLRDIGY